VRHTLAAVLVIPAAGTVATAVGASPAPATGVVPCSLAIRQSERPVGVAGLRLVLGRIWLPRRTVQLAPAAPGWDRFAKVGIVVRAGAPIVLEVPPRWRGVYALEYAPNHVQTVADGSTRLRVQACANELGRWSTYAGGYVVRGPRCVPLTVRADGMATTVHIAIGRPCVKGPTAKTKA
jgi:hypothetical protein